MFFSNWKMVADVGDGFGLVCCLKYFNEFKKNATLVKG
jgi:hypothetical protein